jgi:polysaccharide biosynthesis/export protein
LKSLFHRLVIILIGFQLGACKLYQQNILFKTDQDVNLAVFQQELSLAEQNYTIQPYDIIQLNVFTNYGEMIIDPNFELMQMGGNIMQQGFISREFRIDSEGLAYLPMIGGTQLQGLTLYQADSVLSKSYAAFYQDVFVRTKLINKRVIILGAMGGMVVPLPNDGVNLIEVLALAGGLDNAAKGGNIRIIRGDLSNPAVQVVDLTTIEGLKRAQTKIEPGDIIYVEPWRRVVIEPIRDIVPIVGLLTNILTIILVAQSLNN